MTSLRFCTFLLCMALAFTCHSAFGQFPDEECECTSDDCPKKMEKNKIEAKDLGEEFATVSQGGAVTVTPTKTVIDFNKINKSGSEKNVQDIMKDIMRSDEVDDSFEEDKNQ